MIKTLKGAYLAQQLVRISLLRKTLFLTRHAQTIWQKRKYVTTWRDVKIVCMERVVGHRVTITFTQFHNMEL